MGHGDNVIAMSEAAFGFAHGEAWSEVIVPGHLLVEVVPHVLVGVVERATVFLAPLVDVFIGAPLKDPSCEFSVRDVQESAANTIVGSAQIGVKFIPKFALGVKADLIDHAAKVEEATGFSHGTTGERGEIGGRGHASGFQQRRCLSTDLTWSPWLVLEMALPMRAWELRRLA